MAEIVGVRKSQSIDFCKQRRLGVSVGDIFDHHCGDFVNVEVTIQFCIEKFVCSFREVFCALHCCE
jgi:hypothetical protein